MFITFGTLDELVAINTKVPRQAAGRQAAGHGAARDDYMCGPGAHTVTHTHMHAESVCICGINQGTPGPKIKTIAAQFNCCAKRTKRISPPRPGVIHLAWPGYTYLHEVHEVMMRMWKDGRAGGGIVG